MTMDKHGEETRVVPVCSCFETGGSKIVHVGIELLSRSSILIG